MCIIKHRGEGKKGLYIVCFPQLCSYFLILIVKFYITHCLFISQFHSKCNTYVKSLNESTSSEYLMLEKSKEESQHFLSTYYISSSADIDVC